jgi:hypothetical protein
MLEKIYVGIIISMMGYILFDFMKSLHEATYQKGYAPATISEEIGTFFGYLFNFCAGWYAYKYMLFGISLL